MGHQGWDKFDGWDGKETAIQGRSKGEREEKLLWKRSESLGWLEAESLIILEAVGLRSGYDS